MKARQRLFSVLASAAVLGGAWGLGRVHDACVMPSAASVVPTSAPGSGAGSGATPAPGTGSSGATGGTSPGTASGGTPGKATGTFTGDAEETRYGTVQVSVTLSAGKITDIKALQLTDRDQRSANISSQAAPLLRQEVIAAQSAQVDAISGATYTSTGYLSSLQSALDKSK